MRKSRESRDQSGHEIKIKGAYSHVIISTSECSEQRFGHRLTPVCPSDLVPIIVLWIDSDIGAIALNLQYPGPVPARGNPDIKISLWRMVSYAPSRGQSSSHSPPCLRPAQIHSPQSWRSLLPKIYSIISSPISVSHIHRILHTQTAKQMRT